jgi:hypothetical protein
VSALRNLAYNPVNVEYLLSGFDPLPTLLKFLTRPHVNGQVEACGCLQNLSAVGAGRDAVIDAGSLTLLVRLLNSEKAPVRAAVLGVLTNLTGDARACDFLLHGGAIGPLSSYNKGAQDLEQVSAASKCITRLTRHAQLYDVQAEQNAVAAAGGAAYVEPVHTQSEDMYGTLDTLGVLDYAFAMCTTDDADAHLDTLDLIHALSFQCPGNR